VPGRGFGGTARSRGTGSRPTAVVAALVAGALVLAGCGATSRGPGARGECDTSRGTLVVGLIAPLSGELAAVGLGMKNSADLAVD
jgi:branched-chain amino acid transport system substrate-binding protein